MWQLAADKAIDLPAVIAQPPYKVELGNPKKTVLVEVMKATAAIGVVEDYKLLGKLNLRELSMIGDDADDEDNNRQKLKQPISEPAADSETTAAVDDPAAAPESPPAGSVPREVPAEKPPAAGP